MPNIPEIKIGNTTYKLKDGELRDNIVLAQSTQPTNENNRIWLQENSEDRQVPTWEEFSDVKSALNELKTDERTLKTAIFSKLANGNKQQLSSSFATNIIYIEKSMTVGHKYKIMLKFNNYRDEDFAKLSAFYVATGTSGSDRQEDLINDVKSAVGGNSSIGYTHLDEWVFVEYTATAVINYLRPQYTSSYAPTLEPSIDWAIYDLDVFNFASNDTEITAAKNEADILVINSELYNTISSGNKTQGGNYGSNCIGFDATLYAGKAYNISLKFNGTFNNYLTYLNNLYIATSNASTGRVQDIKSLFTAIESPLSVDKWYTIEYTPIVNVAYLGPAYSSNYSASENNSIDYKVVEKESRIDQIENKIGSDNNYNFTPVNTWEEKAVPSVITQKLNAMENDVLAVFQGDSLTGLIEYSGAQEEPEHCPPGMQYKSWTYWLWKNMARVKPLCDRLDSQRNGSDFFTKTGTWEQADGTKFDNDNYTWDMSQERSVACLTYQSASSNAAVAFTFDADTYDKCNIVFSLKPDGADCEISIAEGNGKMLVSLDRTTWIEANGYTHTQQSNPDGLSYSQVQSAGLAIQQRNRRLWLKKASGVTGNITITYKRASSSASGSYMYCWGIERWSGNTIFVDNIGRGGRYTRFLSYNISDIFDRHPDFAVYEMPLANETDDGLSNIYGFYQQYFISDGNNSYKTRSENYTKVPLIVFMPHGRGLFFDYDNAAIFDATHQVAGDPPAYVIYMAIWNWLRTQLESYSNVSVINLYCRMLNEATGIGQPIKDVFGSNGEYAFTQDTVHLNARGARMYCKYLLPLFQR